MPKKRNPEKPIWTVVLDVRGLISALQAGPGHYPEDIRHNGGWIHIHLTSYVAERIEERFKEEITFSAMERSKYFLRDAGDKKQTYCQFKSFFGGDRIMAEMYFNNAQGSKTVWLPLKPGGRPIEQLVVDGGEQRKRPEYWLAGEQAWVQKILQDCL